MSKQDVQAMFDNVVHIGHRTHKWNPRMKKYIFCEKNGIHIIDLEKTAELLEKAVIFLEKLVSEGRTVLFVSTKPQAVRLLQETAQSVHMPYVVASWIPGLLTNFPTVKTRIKYLTDLKEQESAGEFEKYTKKEVSKLKKNVDKLQVALGGVETMKSLPDAVFVIDAVRDKIVVKEARKLKIPVVAIVDTNADPTMVDYPIPGNDDALKSLVYLIGRVAGACSKKKTVSKSEE